MRLQWSTRFNRKLGASCYSCIIFPGNKESIETVLDGKPYPKEVRLIGNMTLLEGAGGKHFANVVVEEIFYLTSLKNEVHGKPSIDAEEQKKGKEGYRMNLRTGKIKKLETHKIAVVPAGHSNEELPLEGDGNF